MKMFFCNTNLINIYMNLIETYIKEFELLDEGLKSAHNYFLKRSDDEDMFNQLSEIDPTPTKKYLDWIVKQVFNTTLDHQDFIQQARKLIPLFNSAVLTNKLDNIDINHYSNLNDIRQTLSEQDRLDVEDAEILNEDEEYILYLVKSKFAMDIIGKDTKWCLKIKDDPLYWIYHIHEEHQIPYVLVNKQLPVTDPLKYLLIMVTVDNPAFDDSKAENDTTVYIATEVYDALEHDREDVDEELAYVDNYTYPMDYMDVVYTDAKYKSEYERMMGLDYPLEVDYTYYSSSVYGDIPFEISQMTRLIPSDHHVFEYYRIITITIPDEYPYCFNGYIERAQYDTFKVEVPVYFGVIQTIIITHKLDSIDDVVENNTLDYDIGNMLDEINYYIEFCDD